MPQPGLEPGSSDPESSTLTTGLLTPRLARQKVRPSKVAVLEIDRGGKFLKKQ